ncbi:ParB/RepB/Spo0J family partition protein [Sphingopyxis sp. FD7]|uniref:ParB/RepB/Spo0J family partition protein n=1 Tax=Sphingopyxis sp. FD7 TaxID=1914525 RepID=UPI000DC620AA|nr:ParB/RepB/Spo0J family partition protein [Sphingopyxis sp. FD7]BBB11187.1 ParB family chromosome partitioning protein [Sphingopyxis sp. FD7]
MTYPIVYALARNCVASPLNVRTESDPDADAELEAMIGQAGFVLQNLIGTAIKRKKDSYSIFGGGRRLARVHALIEKGQLPEDFSVPVMVMPDAKNAIELSLAENQKLPMTAADECTAFKNMIEKEGKTPAQVAARFGKTERFVLGRVRLADLHETIFEALRKGDITLEVAKAYGSTSDTVRQARVFEQYQGSYYKDDVYTIRRELATGCYRGGDPKALLVGRESYVEAGGRIDSDLFSDSASENWIDGDILDRLADEKLAVEAEAIREREGFGEIRALPTTRVSYTELDGLSPVRGEVPPPTEEDEARCAEIEAELTIIAEAANESDDGITDDDEQRYRDLESELRDIQNRPPVLSDDQKASALAFVVLGEDGQPRVHHQIYRTPEAMSETDDSDDDRDDAAPGGASGKPAISQRLADELATMKAELLRVHVASDPRFALDLGTFVMVDAAQRRYGASDLASELRADAAPSRVIGFESGTTAAEEWAKLEAGLDRSWINPYAGVTGRYDAFCALGEEARAAWLGWAIVRTIQAVPAKTTGSDFVDHLGCKLGIDVAAWWRPTAKNYFKRLTKTTILDLFAEIGGSELGQRYGASKKDLLASSAEQLFAGNIIVEADVKEKALAWLPDAMRFEQPVAELANDDVDVESADAAELTVDDDPVGAGDEDEPVADAA